MFVCLAGRNKAAPVETDALATACTSAYIDDALVKRLLRQGCPPDGDHPVEFTKEGWQVPLATPVPILNAAASVMLDSKRISTLRRLVKAGARVNLVGQLWNSCNERDNGKLDTALDIICSMYHNTPSELKTVKCILELGANPLGFWASVNVPPFNGRMTAPPHVEGSGYFELKSDQYYPPLVAAIAEIGHCRGFGTPYEPLPIVELFLSKPEYMAGYEPGTDAFGLAISFAALYGLKGVVRRLLAMGSPGEAYASRVLAEAAEAGDYMKNRNDFRMTGKEIAEQTELFKILVDDCGADVNYRIYDRSRNRYYGITEECIYPLISCVVYNAVECVTFLLARGADVDRAAAPPVAYEHPPLFEIAEDYPEMMKLLKDTAEHERLREEHRKGGGKVQGD